MIGTSGPMARCRARVSKRRPNRA
ncbi:hypothetical protein R2601_02818 [Salipiger bermudensis HTCC2601]|uniref:Uncharacterized protein n=1 Tax=Salipiger bermudensis (strain DSM 26914 / JCM 13377 / KCTC 12554 / HTCC2601) TaxID=314265 RepID=Q0FWT2_SALBH|nr:hypothetical protein R2601_02818 [Salipiger bermudensis HTCC2601]